VDVDVDVDEGVPLTRIELDGLRAPGREQDREGRKGPEECLGQWHDTRWTGRYYLCMSIKTGSWREGPGSGEGGRSDTMYASAWFYEHGTSCFERRKMRRELQPRGRPAQLGHILSPSVLQSQGELGAEP
jgi:hypothetical protein